VGGWGPGLDGGKGWRMGAGIRGVMGKRRMGAGIRWWDGLEDGGRD
jgi:hypothetical protein